VDIYIDTQMHGLYIYIHLCTSRAVNPPWHHGIALLGNGGGGYPLYADTDTDTDTDTAYTRNTHSYRDQIYMVLIVDEHT